MVVYHPCIFSTSLFSNKYIFKWTIGRCPEFYLTFEISGFDSWSCHHHHSQTPVVFNGDFKRVVSASVPGKKPRILFAQLKRANISTGFYKILEKSTPQKKRFLKIIHNIKQKKNKKFNIFTAWNP